MLSAEEMKFIQYWEDVREFESSFLRKMVRGIPFASLFCMPILIFFIAVYIFFPDWYAKVSGEASAGAVVSVIVAVVVSIVFIAFFKMHFRWEMNEQHYLELKYKQRKDESG